MSADATLAPAGHTLATEVELEAVLGQLLDTLEESQSHIRRQWTAARELLTASVRSGPLLPKTKLDCAPERLAPEVDVYCMGSFQLVVDGMRADRWRSGKARALFQYLVNHRDHPVPRDTLIEALWPDPEAATPANSLKVTVHALREHLSGMGWARDCLAFHESGYQLIGSGLWLDVEEFERCHALARRLDAVGRTAEALDLYARAADLYRGDFLEESWDDWVLFRREALKDQYLFVLARLADAALAAGDYQGCIVRCQQLLENDRCREDSYRVLMICHARLGQRNRVRRWYELCVRALRTELDVAPEPETERIYRQALSGQA